MTLSIGDQVKVTVLGRARQHPFSDLIWLAESQRVEPLSLERVPYATLDDVRVLVPSQPAPFGPPCYSCGHPRWAHALPGCFWDGSCLCGCECDNGYVPGAPKAVRVVA